MNYIRFAIENPVKVAVGVLLLMLFGLLALFTIPIQLTPNVDQPVITVTTEWTGRSPEEVEREIVERQEDVLKNVSGLSRMTSTAYLGRSEVQLEFFVGVDIRAARQEVSDSLREVPEYPQEANEPVVSTSEAGAGSPIAWLILTAEDPDFDVQTVGDPVTERVKPYLERVVGVSEVRVYGGREREVHVEIDPRRLAQRGITFNQFYNALRLENVNVSAGEMREGQYDIRVRTIGQYDELEQVRQTIVAYDAGGGPVRVADLGDVRLTYAKRRSFVRSRGEIALALPVYRESGANVIRVMEDLKQRIAEVERDVLPVVATQTQMLYGLAEPPVLHLKQVYDETVYIYDALNLVLTNLLIGGCLAGVALLVFLRSYRPTVVVALSIPISIVGTFVVMTAFGRNLNVISLAGLAFAVGMVVDAAIVVLENIDRHLGMGKSPRQAALEAAGEVWGAILASTLTTLAVFVPVLTIQEEAGQLFRDIALAICAAVSLSLLVSITVIPTASGRFLVSHREPRTKLLRAGRALFGLAPLGARLTSGFAGLIHRLMERTAAGVGARVGIVAAFTLAAVIGAYLLMPPTDYLPRGNQNLVFGFVLTPPSYTIEQDAFIADRVEATIRPYWEATTPEQVTQLPPLIHPFTQQPIERIPPIDNYFFVSFFGGVFNGATSGDKQNVAPVADLLTAATNHVPGVIGFAQQSSLFTAPGGGVGRSVEVDVLGLNLDSVLSSAGALRMALMEQFGPMGVQPNPANFDKPGRELQVRIDRVRAADLGIDVSALGAGVRALVDGLYVGDFRLRGETIDILAIRDPAVAASPEELAQMPLAYHAGDGTMGTVPLSAVATLQRADAPQQIRRIDEQRAVTLQVNPPDEMPLEVATRIIENAVAELRAAGQVPPDVRVALAGSASKLAEVREAMLGEWHGVGTSRQIIATLQSLLSSRIFLALLVTYLLMAALFESWLYPFVIMFTVPLATIGGFIGLRFVHDGWAMQAWPLIGDPLYGVLGPHGIRLIDPTQQLDTLTMLGFIILIGIVVNNAILIVHQSLNFMRGLGDTDPDSPGHGEPLAPREAIREAVRTRVRPICMTTATSVSGMLPLVLMPGAGSELYRGLGSVVVGGLLVSALFTLIVVPLLFSLVLDAKAWVTAALSRGEAGRPAAPQPG
jgi:HAE1 family hydrophobic/amphiphilic exporter-1